MITKTIYKCEICGQEYDTEQAAIRCEGSHVDAEFITHQTFPKTEKYPKSLIITMANNHKIQYVYDKPILVEPSDDPYFTDVSAGREAGTNNVVLTAIGERLPEHDDYSWVVLCDETRIPVTSNEPTVTLTPAATRIFDIANMVKVKVSTPNVPAGQFVVKYDE